MKFFEKTESQEYIYRGKIISVRRDDASLSDGRLVTREVCEHNGGVAVLPITDDGEVILVRQFRYPFGCELTEAPAGKLEKGEDPLACGIRELSEETGYTARDMRSLGWICPSPGYLTEKIYLYLATGLTGGEAHPDEGEELRILRIPLESLLELCDTGDIHDAKTIALAYRAARILKKQ